MFVSMLQVQLRTHYGHCEGLDAWLENCGSGFSTSGLRAHLDISEGDMKESEVEELNTRLETKRRMPFLKPLKMNKGYHQKKPRTSPDFTQLLAIIEAGGSLRQALSSLVNHPDVEARSGRVIESVLLEVAEEDGKKKLWVTVNPQD